jgi:hypothetical protein
MVAIYFLIVFLCGILIFDRKTIEETKTYTYDNTSNEGKLTSYAVKTTTESLSDLGIIGLVLTIICFMGYCYCESKTRAI